MIWVEIAVAGGIGSILRWLTGLGMAKIPHPRAAMWGTTAANLVGAGLLGVVARLAVHGTLSPAWTLILGAGFVGAYTTYSTWAFEVAALVRARDGLGAATVFLVNLMGGIVLYSGVRYL